MSTAMPRGRRGAAAVANQNQPAGAPETESFAAAKSWIPRYNED